MVIPEVRLFFPKRFPTSIARNRKDKKFKKRGKKCRRYGRARSTVISRRTRHLSDGWGARNDSAGTPRRRVSGLIYSLPRPPPSPPSHHSVRRDSIIQHRHPSPPNARVPPLQRATRTPNDTGTPQPRDYCRVIV